LLISIVNTDKVNATLEHNWFFNLFDQISIKLGTNELETIENPGEISSLLNFVMTDSDYKNQYGELTGWITEPNGNKIRQEIYGDNDDGFKFEGMYPLKNLFGFFQNYNHPIYLISFELGMIKNEYYKKCFYGKDILADAKLSIVFEDLKLLVPSITCNPKLEQDVMERMNSSNPISINYLNRITASIDIPIESIYSWRPTTLNSRPRYILIGFKDATPEFKEINSKFI